MKHDMLTNSPDGKGKSSEDKEDPEEKAQKALSRKHKLKRSHAFYLLLLFSTLGIVIYVIEYYQ